MPPDLRAYIARETAISVAINSAISAGFAWLMFGGSDQVPIWGAAGLAVDFIPQTFMIALMSTAVPTALTRKRLRSGTLSPAGSAPFRLPGNLIVRALGLAIAATLILAPTAMLLLTAASNGTIGFATVLAMKIVYGALVAVLVTPLALTVALAEPRGRA